MSNNKDYVLAIDNGTQSVRALVFDLEGQLVAKSKVEIEPYYSDEPGWAEQRVEYFWENLCKACNGLWPQLDFPKSAIKSVALTTQRATVVNLDAEGKAAAPGNYLARSAPREKFARHGYMECSSCPCRSEGYRQVFSKPGRSSLDQEQPTGNLGEDRQIPAAFRLPDLSTDRKVCRFGGESGGLPALRFQAP